MRTHAVQNLLMGGQACILYGAAEFSRDVDLAVLADTENLVRLRCALEDLNATVIAVPPFEAQYLRRGHAIHFRCGRDDVRGLRIDVMSKMRGVDPFAVLWMRRTTMQLSQAGDALEVDVLSLPDLVAAKKTQRDKDWPMIRRLVEANFVAFRDQPTDERTRFWMTELRSPMLLIECAAEFGTMHASTSGLRPALSVALARDVPAVERELLIEQERERELDREHWAPLRMELEELRHRR